MQQDLIEPFVPFVWERPSGDSYRWTEIAGDLILTLREGAFPPQPYRPLEDCPGLFRTFADLEQTPEAALAFANQYGSLLHTSRHRALEGPKLDVLLPPECFHDFWQKEIHGLTRLVSVWDACQAGNASAVRRLLGDWGKNSWPRILKREKIQPADWVARGNFYLAVQLSAKLRGIRYLKHLPSEPAILPLLKLDEHHHPRLTAEPNALIHALYLQFAQAIDGDRQFRRCLVCGAWFPVGADEQSRRQGQRQRSDKVVCSPACRVLRSARRKVLARQLYAKGKPIETIAREVGSTDKQVEQWIRQQKG
jgi:hypothetical protein